MDDKNTVNQINKDAAKFADKLNIKDQFLKSNEKKKTHIYFSKTTNIISISCWGEYVIWLFE